MAPRGTLEERFWRKVVSEPNNGCWLWIGAIRRGYGCLYNIDKVEQAHVVAWKLYRGPVPEGLELDHLCRVKNCVNPDHLEPVTRKVNLLRGVGVPAVNARKTHCPYGHEYTEENTRRVPNGRNCRICHNAAQRAYKKRKREEVYAV